MFASAPPVSVTIGKKRVHVMDFVREIRLNLWQQLRSVECSVSILLVNKDFLIISIRASQCFREGLTNVYSLTNST